MPDYDPLTLQWMFQYNPTNYNLESSIERSLIEDWKAPKCKEQFRVGQRVYFMRSAGGRHIDTRRFTAVGRIASQVYEQLHPRTNVMRPVIDVVYDRIGLSPAASRWASAHAVRRSWLEPAVLTQCRFHISQTEEKAMDQHSVRKTYKEQLRPTPTQERAV